MNKNSNLTTKLPFSHGVEIENHLIKKVNGEILIGDDLITLWELMFSKAYEYLLAIKKKKKGPKEILQKIQKIEVEEVKKHGHSAKLKFIFLTYKLRKKLVRVNIFGPDPNISQITWLLELVTPPCEFLEELDWWVSTLYECALHGLKHTKPEIVLLPIGLNPDEKRFRSGLSCGSHHHIGVPLVKERIAIYNMLRNYIPHLIALTASSPFINKGLHGNAKIRKVQGKSQVIGRYTHSIRIANNTGQIGPNIPQYLPILKTSATKEKFSTLVKKVEPEDRMVDIYPFTDYGTIELRFFDAQPYKENRLAIILLLQSLALKALSILKDKRTVPSVQSSTLFTNRMKSIELGLLAQFSIDESLEKEFPEFAASYNYDVCSGKKVSKLLDSVKSMLYYLKDELESFSRPDILNYLLLPIFGTAEFLPPFSVTEFMVSEYLANNLSYIYSKIFYTQERVYSQQSAHNMDFFDTLGSKMQPTAMVTAKNNSSELSSKLKKDVLERKKKELPVLSAKEKKDTTKKPKGKTKTKKTTVITNNIKQSKKLGKINLETPSTLKDVSEELLGDVKPETSNKTIFSAFDIIEEEDFFTPTIEIEPKYTSIESKIATVMRKRKTEILKRKKELYKEHLEAERKSFAPPPKKIKLQFPKQVSGRNVYGSVSVVWHQKSIFKLRKNSIIFYFSVIKPATKERFELKSYSTTLNSHKALETGSSHIPIFFSLEEIEGDLEIDITAITATNELIFRQSIDLKRKDDLKIKLEEFYLNGNYGPVECIIQAKNKGESIKGNLELYLAVQEYATPLQLKKEQFFVKQNEIMSFFSFVDCKAIYHNAPFLLVAQFSTGRFKKTKHFEAILIKPITDLIAEWYISIPDGKPDITAGVSKKTKYDLDFVFHFNKSLPPISISIFLYTFPEGPTKKIAASDVKRDIDMGDELRLEHIKFKTPKNIGYVFFEVEFRTKDGIIPVDLISDPIGISTNQDNN